MPLEVIWFIADRISIQQYQIQHFPVVEPGHRNHQRSLRIDIAAYGPRSGIDPEIRDRIILHQPVLWPFAGKDEVRIYLVGGRAELSGHRHIASIDVSWRDVTMIRAERVFHRPMM